MGIKMRCNKSILTSAILSAVLGCFFITNVKEVKASDANNTSQMPEISITVEGSSQPTDTVKQETAPAPVANTVAEPLVFPATSYAATDSSHSLAIVLPGSFIIGDENLNIASVTGYRVYAYNNGTELYNSGDDYKDAGSGFIDLETLVREKLSDKLVNVSENLTFKVIYIGKKSSGEYAELKDVSGNNIEWSSDPLAVYRVSIGGDKTGAVSTYGFSGQSVVLIPAFEKGYQFESWADGNTQNPRIEKISTDTAKNIYAVIAKETTVEMTEDGGYDPIPKTGESNSWFFLIALSVFAVIGTGYALFMMLLPIGNANNESFEDFRRNN